MDARLYLAVLDNARWCDRVCVANGRRGRFDDDAWTCPERTPPMYPDAVTLRPDAPAGTILDRIDAGAGASVKDSFATLDLGGAGFEVLFDASWIHRPPGPPAGRVDGALAWGRVATAVDLAAWASDHGAGPTFPPSLLDDPAVAILVAPDRSGQRRAGAIATIGTEAIGISNVFVVDTGIGLTSDGPTFDDAFAGATRAIATRWPDRPIVGYEAGDELAVATSAGFAPIGPLRVWLRRDA